MKNNIKYITILTFLSLISTTIYATDKIKEEIENDDTQIISTTTIPKNEWKFTGRTYLETEDFDNDSPLIRSDDEDGTFLGTGINATKDKLSLDLNVERRLGGDLALKKSEAEWKSTRIDYKIRYQLFPNQAFHLKYRNEQRNRDYSKKTYHNDWERDRFEIGTDWNHFNGKFAGWLVAGYDKDKTNIPGIGTTKEKGWYWEGDFGPNIKLTEKLSLNPTLYTTGERYDSYDMTETQLRVMTPYKVNEKLTIMPRIRFTLDRENKDSHGNTIWKYKPGDRIRYELLADATLTKNISTFVGVAYEKATRDFKNDSKKDIDMIWTYTGLNYKFN